MVADRWRFDLGTCAISAVYQLIVPACLGLPVSRLRGKQWPRERIPDMTRYDMHADINSDSASVVRYLWLRYRAYLSAETLCLSTPRWFTQMNISPDEYYDISGDDQRTQSLKSENHQIIL